MSNRLANLPSEKRPARLVPLILFTGGLLSLFAAITCWILDATSQASSSCLAVAGAILLGASLGQLLNARAAWIGRREHERFAYIRRRPFRRAVLVGPVVAYLLTLCWSDSFRDGKDAIWLCAALFSVWLMLITWPPAMRRSLADRLGWFAQRKSICRAGMVGFSCLAIVVIGEVSLRVYHFSNGDRVSNRLLTEQLKLLPGSELWGQQVNSLGFADEEFSEASERDRYRIAILGDEITLSGVDDARFLRMVQRWMPEVEIENFSLPKASLRQYTSLLLDEVALRKPDLVLCLVSLGDDLTEEVRGPTWYEWRGLQLGQLIQGMRIGTPTSKDDSIKAEPVGRREYLQNCARRLAVCRTPLSDETEQRWTNSFSHLRDLTEQCQVHELPLALAAVPAEFQVDRVLLTTLSRRMHLGTDALDVELPQRRMSVFAQEQGVPLLDLLPRLRAASEPVFAKDRHCLSRRGNVEVAEALSRWLSRSYGEPIAAARATRVRVATGSVSPLKR